MRAVMLPEQHRPDCEVNHSNTPGLTHTTQERANRPWAWCERVDGGSGRDTLAIEQRSQSNLYLKINRSNALNQGTGTRISGGRKINLTNR